jgi:hypothetical protein
VSLKTCLKTDRHFYEKIIKIGSAVTINKGPIQEVFAVIKFKELPSPLLPPRTLNIKTYKLIP